MADSHPTAPDKDCDHDDNSFCLALHSLTPFFHVAVLEKPDFALAFNLDFISTALPVESPVGTFVLRQPPDREFVFTPEVSLGAAFRSLAPPVLA